MSKIVPTVLVAAGLGLSLIGCGGNRVEPCSTLQPPTPQEIAAVVAGSDVEREVEMYGHEYECELTQGVGGGFSWQQEQDDH